MRARNLEAKITGEQFFARGRDCSPTCNHCGSLLYAFLSTCPECNAPVKEVAKANDFFDDLPGKGQNVFRLAHVSDIHLGVAQQGITPDWCLRRWCEQFKLYDVDCVVVSGDIVDKPTDERSLRLGHQILDRDWERPWVIVPGNHDVQNPGRKGLYEEIFGSAACTLRLGFIEFVLFDSMSGLPQKERPWGDRFLKMVADCFTEGAVGQAQLDHVEKQLERQVETVRVMVLHHHLTRQNPDPIPKIPKDLQKLINQVLPKDFHLNDTILNTMQAALDAPRIIDWAANNGVVAALHGHKHIMQNAGLRSGDVLVLNGGSSTIEFPHRKRARLLDIHRQGHRRVATLEMRF